MPNIIKKNYSIIDIETTGIDYKNDKIIEIAVLIYRDKHIINRFHTLVHPERTVPSNITRITGINDEMLQEAPKFYEIARKVAEITENCIFVAHNVRFDYGFIKREFEELGFTFTRNKMCTVKLSRMYFPEIRSHSLGSLIKYHNIKIVDRHRALDDALATVELFQLIEERMAVRANPLKFIKENLKASKLPKGIHVNTLAALPALPGVYYFLDEGLEPIYIGKSIHIQHRVVEHFVNRNSKGNKLFNFTRQIAYVLTGSDLLAAILESHEIKRHQPIYNKAQKRKSFPYLLQVWSDSKSYKRLVWSKAKKVKSGATFIASFSSKSSLDRRMELLIEKFELCKTYCEQKQSRGPCFNWHIEACHGACVEAEAPEVYNLKVDQAIQELSMGISGSFLIIENGRQESEIAIVAVEDGQFKGLAFVEQRKDLNLQSIEQLELIPYPHSKDIEGIIKRYLSKNREANIVHLDGQNSSKRFSRF